MDYFKRLLQLLNLEREEDRKAYENIINTLPVQERRASGLTWYPIVIKDTEMGHGDFLTVEVERPTHQDIIHQFRFGTSAALFSNYEPENNRVEGIISYIAGNRLKITLRTDELPEWARDGKLGIDAVFDENSYEEMQNALKQASTLAEKREEGHLIRLLLGEEKSSFHNDIPKLADHKLNSSQQAAVQKILTANQLAIVHGPPGTGKTTTLVQAIKAILQQDRQQLLVVAPSNTAVDLLSEKLTDEGLNVVRVGNPARVSERLMSLTLDSKMALHPDMKEIKRLKKRANEFRDMAHKYKRNFGREEREQRKALFAEARNISKQVENMEQYIVDDVLSKANVITATLVGANHYTVRQLKFNTVVIDEAGQALEPASWIPILKSKKVVLAGDHCQLPPTIKSNEAAQNGLSSTLLEKCVAQHPEAVVLLEEQYRMNELIMGYSSQVFYNSKLKAHPTVAQQLLFPEDRPLSFIDTAGCGFDEKLEGTSICNPEEASFLLKYLQDLALKLNDYYAPGNFPSIAVISPYKHQVEMLKEQMLLVSGLAPFINYISVNTIDSFQGQERDVVCISMARSNTENVIGFLSDIRRMNVAMTRAKKKLVVIGDSATLSQLPFYADFINYTQEQDAYQSAWEFNYLG
ncbi:AAA domain-containing protein [Chitinophagaceae bacterium LB-8]|uniref:AAA domain-containing protein n=1 Tax=Paraflavisolibacter caeni TaxID=2982496 RepID=A0A9X3B7A7_9BACT|nr:AAA domain-containing protein [Paraflavisolibacter caeni]MCU7548990.1 AAA domain-containing protein [Paraflavisolibacter caeni]